jgi:hypothetical protein
MSAIVWAGIGGVVYGSSITTLAEADIPQIMIGASVVRDAAPFYRGSRPAAPKDLGFASAYLFGAVCPAQGKAAGLIMPICNTLAMNHHLSEISSQVSEDAHAVLILDRAGWHRSQALVVPGNITLLELPP